MMTGILNFYLFHGKAEDDNRYMFESRIPPWRTNVGAFLNTDFGSGCS